MSAKTSSTNTSEPSAETFAKDLTSNKRQRIDLNSFIFDEAKKKKNANTA